ncbi:dynein regulatory complex subunit 5 [Rhinophrynus dorsalis]
MLETPINVRVSVPAPLPFRERNPAADLRKMRRIIAEDPTWSLALVPPLTGLCLEHIIKNFQNYPILEKLLPKHQVKVLNQISTSLPLKVTAKLIDYEDYWRRCCAERWPVCDISHYGGSWKRMFLERHLEYLIEHFIPDLTDTGSILETVELSKDYIRKLDIKALLPPVKLDTKKDDEADDISDSGSDAGMELPSMDHFDLGLIAPSLQGLEELHLVYGLKNCGMNFEWNLFHFTDRDCTSLSKTFKIFRSLKSQPKPKLTQNKRPKIR